MERRAEFYRVQLPLVLLNSAWLEQRQRVAEVFGTLEAKKVCIDAGMDNLGACEGNARPLRVVRVQFAVKESMYGWPMPLFLHSTVRKPANHAHEAALDQVLKEGIFWKFCQKAPPKPAPMKGKCQTSTAFICDEWEVLPRQKGQQLLAKRHDMPQVNQVGLESADFALHACQVAHVRKDFT